MNSKDIRKVLESLPEDMQKALFEAVKKADSPEELYRLTMVGDCPKCTSSKTRDCGDDIHEGSQLDDPTIGMCLDCAILWCLECDEIFEEGQTICEHWTVCNECKFSTEEGCDTPTWECSIIQDWKKDKGD